MRIEIEIEQFNHFSSLEADEKKLVDTAFDFLENAYAPYSNFKVAASIQLQNGKIVSGSNQENAAYPMCVCAEVTALSACNAVYPATAPCKMAIVIRHPNQPSTEPAAPCGQCRQTILEYENRFKQDIAIIMVAENGMTYRVNSIKKLLPLYFSNKNL